MVPLTVVRSLLGPPLLVAVKNVRLLLLFRTSPVVLCIMILVPMFRVATLLLSTIASTGPLLPIEFRMSISPGVCVCR